MTIAENNIWPKDIKAMFNHNYEEDDRVSDTPKSFNDSKVFYFGSKTDPSVFWGHPNNDVVVNNEWEERLPFSRDISEEYNKEKTNIYKNNEMFESNLRTFTVNPNDKEIVIDENIAPIDEMKSAEIEEDYNQLMYPELMRDNTADYKNTIDLRGGADLNTYFKNYDQRFVTEHKFPDNLNKKEQILNVRDRIDSFQLVPQYLENTLPRPTYNLPIPSQPGPFMNILSTRTPKHHHQNYHVQPKFEKSILPNYYTNLLPRQRNLYSHLHSPSTQPMFNLNRYNN